MKKNTESRKALSSQTAQEWADEMFIELGLAHLVEKPKITKNSAVSSFVPKK